MVMEVYGVMVSIVVPVYNVELYVAKCIESVLEQSYDEWELLLIDDGSEDGSGEICDKYAKEDSRIKVIHQKNRGVSVARNMGIEKSQGDYITFLDPDDYLSKEYLEQMLNCLLEATADIAISSMCQVTVFGDIIGFESEIKEKEVIASRTAMVRCLYERQLVPGVCGKIFKRNVWGGHRFLADCVLAEDVWALYGILNTMRKVVLCDEGVYYVRVRPGSALRSSFTPYKMSALDLCERIVEESYKNSQENIYKAAVAKLVAVSFHLWLQLSAAAPAIYHERCWQKIKKYRCRVIFDTQAKKKARIACGLSFLGGGLVKGIFVLSESIKRYVKRR